MHNIISNDSNGLLEIIKSIASTDIIYFNPDLFILFYNDFTRAEIQLTKKDNLYNENEQHLFYLKSNDIGYVTTTLKSTQELIFQLLKSIDLIKRLKIEKVKLRLEPINSLPEKTKEFPSIGVNKKAVNKLNVLTKIELKDNLEEKLFLKPECTNFIFRQSLFKKSDDNLYYHFDLNITEDTFYLIYLDSMRDKVNLVESNKSFYLLEPIAIIRIKNEFNDI